MKYSLDELKDAFSEVADKDDWKRPIEAVVPADRLGIIICAITHYTATAPTIEPVTGDVVVENGDIVGLRYRPCASAPARPRQRLVGGEGATRVSAY